MDEFDIKIILLLFSNSRLTYRELSKHLDLSINAVYKRVQNLINLNIIQKFVASLKPYAVNAIYVFIMGQSTAENLDQALKQIGNHDNTWQIILSSRNFMYIGSLLEDINQLEDYSSYVSRIGRFKSPKVGILSGVQYSSPVPYIVPKSRSPSYDKLDLEIIRSLHNNSRKPISEVADEIKSSPSTIRRRLNRLIEEGIIDLSFNFNPEDSNDIFAVFQISTKPTINKKEFAKYLNETYSPNLFYCWTFSNLPGFILCWVWANTMKELNELIENIKNEKIQSIIFDIMYKAVYFNTWKEKILHSN